MNYYDDTIVYILSPANRHTGGIELLHQLASQLVALGVNAQMAYFDKPPQVCPVDAAYRKYHLDYTCDIMDHEHNIVVCPETVTPLVMVIHFAQKVIWWMSVDNYLLTLREYLKNFKEEWQLKHPMVKLFYFSGNHPDIIHWYQSEYARQFLLLNDVQEKQLIAMEDYLSQEFLSNLQEANVYEKNKRKEKSVAFNPIKGFETTQILMEKRPDINWQPIENMTAAEVRTLLLHTQIYIDFGNHPGKDRIPREAAMSGCVVITGKRGAAANDIDINLPSQFKCPDNDYDHILHTIDEVFADFKTAYDQQSAYRERILNDYNRFKQEIIENFGIDTSKLPLWCAVINDTGNIGITIAQALASTPCEYCVKFLIDDYLADYQNPLKPIRVENQRCYLPLDNHQEIEIITASDADFLYLEGRINKIFYRNIADAKQTALHQQLIHINKKDLLPV